MFIQLISFAYCLGSLASIIIYVLYVFCLYTALLFPISLFNGGISLSNNLSTSKANKVLLHVGGVLGTYEALFEDHHTNAARSIRFAYYWPL